MRTVDRIAAEHRARLERFQQQADRVRENEVRSIAIDILGIPADDVARALRGNLTKEDEEDDG